MALLKERHLKIDYWDLAPRATNFSKVKLEEQLKLLASHDLRAIPNFSDLNEKADLLVIDALVFDDENIAVWFKKLHQNIVNSNAIWIPTLILTDSTDFVLEDLHQLILSNWYFDFLHPDHMTSLPIRCVNLIKMNDHIREIDNYSQQLESLEKEVKKIKQEAKLD